MGIEGLVADFEARGLVHDCTDLEALARRLADGPVTVYHGIDPTADSLHVGHLVGVLALRRFQMAGHHAVALAGGATGMVGDPSGRSMLSPRREPQPQPDRRVGKQRERVPVADRRAEASEAPAVGEERRHDLAEERPAEDAGENDGERGRYGAWRAGHDGADEEPEAREGEVHEPAVRVRPRAIRVERPRDRRPVPQDEKSRKDEEGDSGPVGLGPWENAEQRRRDRERRGQHRRRPKPCDREVVRAAAEEERPDEEGRHAACEGARHDRERPEPRGRDIRSRAHGR